MAEQKLNNKTRKTRISIGGITVTNELVEKVMGVLMSFDRMPENPDYDFLRSVVERQLQTEGLLRLILFVCPKFNTKALLGAKKEEYLPVEIVSGDLFEPRVKKVAELRDALFALGVVSTLEVVIGDNDFSTYIIPFLDDFQWDTAEVRNRQKLYRESFEVRAKELFGILSTVWSLSELDITASVKTVMATKEQLDNEVEFFRWLFSEEGPYKGNFNFDDATLEKMARIKFGAYGDQGEFLEEIEGILLQTEGPEVWLLRTQMLRCTGAKAVPAIYPWIRKGELES